MRQSIPSPVTPDGEERKVGRGRKVGRRQKDGRKHFMIYATFMKNILFTYCIFYCYYHLVGLRHRPQTSSG